MKLSLFISLIVIFNCTSIHYISKESLVSQIEKSVDSVFILGINNGIIKARNNLGIFYFNENELDSEMLYKINNSSNNSIFWFNLLQMKQIECKNKKGDNVLIGLDHNSQLIFIDSLNRKTQMYFQPTLYFDSLFIGYRSVLLHIKNKIKYNDINQINIYSEFKKEHKIE